MMLPPRTINTMNLTPGPGVVFRIDSVFVTFAVATDVALIVSVTVVVDELVAVIVITLSLRSSKRPGSVPGTAVELGC